MGLEENFADRIARKISNWVLDQIKPELCLEAKMLKPRLSYFGPIMRRQDSLEKTAILGEVKGSRKRRSTPRWVDSLKQWSPTLGLHMFLDYNSQKPTPPPLLARISGS